MNKQQALQKLAAICSQAEQCRHDLEEKMKRWEISEADQAEIMDYLVSERYVDDSRYARYFVKDKLRFNKWGHRKIELALWQKHIDKTVGQEALDEIADDEYIAVLRPLMRQKARSVKASSDYERNAKLVRFALGRGFTYDVIKRCVDFDGDIDEF